MALTIAKELSDAQLEKLAKSFSTPTLSANLGNISSQTTDVKIGEIKSATIDSSVSSSVSLKEYDFSTPELSVNLDNISNIKIGEIKSTIGPGVSLKEYDFKDISWAGLFGFDKENSFQDSWKTVFDNIGNYYSVNWENANTKIADFYVSSAKDIASSWENFGSNFTDGSLNWDNFKVNQENKLFESFTDKTKQIEWKKIGLSDKWALQAFDNWLGTDLVAGLDYGLAVTNFTLTAVDNMMSAIDNMLKNTSTTVGTWISDVSGMKFIGDWLTEKLQAIHFGDTFRHTNHYLVDEAVKKSANPELPLYKTSPKKSFKNKPVQILEYLNKNYPDEFSNLFDVYFVLTKKNEKQPDTDKSKSGSLPISSGDANQNIENTFPKILSSRVESITIPGRSVGSFEQKAMGSNIVKSTTRLETKQRSSFVLQADSSLYWLHVFNKMSQTDFSNVEDWKKSIVSTKLGTNGELPFNIFLSDYTLDIYVVAIDLEYNHKKAPIAFKDNIFLKAEQFQAEEKRKREEAIKATMEETKAIDKYGIMGLHNLFENKLKTLGQQLSKTADEIKTENESAQTNQNFQDLPARLKWVFEDCRLLGSGTPISFKKDSSDPLKFTYDFTFKKLSKR